MSEKLSRIRLGFSTGTTYKHLTVGEALRALLQQGIDIAELCYVRYNQLQREVLTQDDLRGFRYLSLHAPNDIIYGSSKESRLVIENITRLHTMRPFEVVVFHPYTDMDLDFFSMLPFPVAFENMDATKNFGKTIAELKKVFINPAFTMVLDLNHVYTLDQTMQLGKDIYNTFQNRIVQIHLSGFEILHDPLYKTKQTKIIDSIPDLSLPIIVESMMQPREIQKERNYIVNNLPKV